MHIAALEERSGKRFGDPSDPLLVSVRSGAAISMPGMMDTILNLGLTDVAVEGQAASTGNPRFAYDSYRRLIQMYGEVVDGVDGQRFEGAIADLKAAAGRGERPRARRRRPARADRDLPADLRGGGRLGLPAGSARAAAPRLPRRLRLVGRAARAGVPPHVRDPGRHRHGRQRRPDGVRQQGRELGHGRLLHARPVDRRVGALRRVPRQRAGRGRRLGHPHAGADLGDAAAAAGGVRAADRDPRSPRGALPRHAGHRVHGRGGPAVPAPDPHRQAHRDGRAPRRGRDGGRGADRPRGGGGPDRSRASSTSCSIR